MEDLNSLVEMPPGQFLWDARKINNRGDILADGLLLTAGGIVHPSPGRLVVSGTPDTIRWNAPDGLGLLDVQLNTRALAAPDDYSTLGVVPAGDGQFAYLPPDTVVTTQCRLRLVSLSSPDTIRSGIFRMKPLTITKLDALGNYVPFRLGRDNWSQPRPRDDTRPEISRSTGMGGTTDNGASGPGCTSCASRRGPWTATA